MPAQSLDLPLLQTLRVRRVWDPAHKTLLYIAYSTHATNGHDDDAGGLISDFPGSHERMNNTAPPYSHLSSLCQVSCGVSLLCCCCRALQNVRVCAAARWKR